MLIKLQQRQFYPETDIKTQHKQSVCKRRLSEKIILMILVL